MGSRRVAPGDNLVTYCQGIVSGYTTELERTMFYGAPSARQREPQRKSPTLSMATTVALSNGEA